jgi:hypothetical protein
LREDEARRARSPLTPLANATMPVTPSPAPPTFDWIWAQAEASRRTMWSITVTSDRSRSNVSSTPIVTSPGGTLGEAE